MTTTSNPLTIEMSHTEKVVEIAKSPGTQAASFTGGLSVPESDTQMNLRTVIVGNQTMTAQQLAAEPKRPAGLHGPVSGPGIMPNFVKTSLYELYNFVPKFLIKSFSRTANVYFLMICCLQSIRAISITDGKPSTAAPLMFILTVAALKEINEDLTRHKSDHEENTTKTHLVASDGQYYPETKDVSWKDVKVGDVIEIRNREAIPADVVLLETSHPEGQAQIMTANLDGETNLKTMQANSDMIGSSGRDTNAHMGGYGGEVVCELPNNRILNFEGTFTRPDGNKVSLNPKNVLLRGVTLRQTDWVRGIVTYTGKETKIQMNGGDPPSKTSKVMGLANTLTFWMFAVDITLSMCAGIASSSYLSTDWVTGSWYLWGAGNAPPDAGEIGFLTFGTHILIFTNLIPISLLVTIDMVKLGQAKMLQYDLDMYHEIKDHAGDITEIPMTVQRSDLNEELGQVKHIFSDKTGTLTCNMMDFRKCSINGKSYGLGTTAIGLSFLRRNNMPIPAVPIPDPNDPETPHVNFVDPEFAKIIADPNHPEHSAARDFFLCLALNHDVLPEENKSGEVIYSASSPDEAALVYAAKHFGFFFKRTESGGKKVVETKSGETKYEVLEFLEFNSDRKRSSVLYKDVKTGKLVLFCKGADNVMKKRLKTPASSKLMSDTEKHLNQFVDDGLRTLLVGKTTVDPSFYANWKKRFQDAENSLEDRDGKRMAVMEEIEVNLDLIGVTAIEDKLQDGVDEALVKFRGADIKVWMLTGDKVDTAINIGYSCSLLDTGMTLLRACGEDGDMELDHDKVPTEEAIVAKLEKLEDQARESGEGGKPCALVLDTAALSAILQYEKEIDLNHICQQCDSVICARVTPRQKASIVDMVRRADPNVVTLSIGDGANDVPMIQTAHIGIGIHGLEGKQAVNNSDYAIGQFKFLKKLLLVHGRWNYRRTCKVCLYMFYKNIVYVFPQFLFGMFCMASGQPIYNDSIYQGYNTFYTATPIVIFGIMDRDCSKETAFKYPWLYRDGQNNNFMTTPIFFRWVGEGMAHAIFVFFISVGCHHSGIFDKEGKSLDLFTIGTIVNMMAVVVASGRLYCETRYFNFPTFYKPQGGGLFFEGLVSWTGSGWSWQLLSFGFWWWSFYLFSKKGEEYALHGYFKELGGSWQILSQDAGLYCCMFLAMAFTVGLTFALFLAPDQFSKPLLSTLAAETDKLDKQTADDQSGTVVEQV